MLGFLKIKLDYQSERLEKEIQTKSHEAFKAMLGFRNSNFIFMGFHFTKIYAMLHKQQVSKLCTQ